MKTISTKNLRNKPTKTTDEFEKIETVSARLGVPSAQTIVGIGDDAAVVFPPKGKMLFCSDAMVEGVHFDFHYTNARELGHKALASCLSDIVAMNGRALYAVISLAIPSTLGPEFVDEFYDGAGRLARKFGVDIVGGDLTASPQTVFIDVAAVGETDFPVLRTTAKTGDVIAVSGTPGKSAAGLTALRHREKEAVHPSLCDAHLKPQPRFDLIKDLPHGILTSLIDISDGLSSEINHIADHSQVGFEIDARLFPIDPEARKEAGSREEAVRLALSGGEDYELLATFDAKTFASSPPNGFTSIGRVTPASDGRIVIHLDGTRSTLASTGYNHFTINS